ncbi:MAG: XrtA-associated tyrosine autokinase [Rubrivivax sp.]|nr:XrtA-associated tyrosine autokinase [Rubrivivax sp.]
MSTLIEQAALRLQQLRQAGIDVPDLDPPAAEAREPAPARHAPARETQVQPTTAQSVSRRVEVDLDALANTGIVTPNAPRSALADQFRVIKRPLIANALGKGAATLKHGNLIMVTSAIAGEGKTFTSVNLAMSIAAEMDHTVMLVDADVARPSVLRVLGLPAGPGLLDVLEGKVELSGALLRTSVDKLTILPSGTPHARATELLASDAMGALLDDMATRYPDRIIIFDSPPLLLTTESRVLATHMGQIVVVVHAGRTLQSDVQHALSTIESCPVRMMLLNRARADSAGAYSYGYGYGAYGYGYGHGRGDAEALAPEASAKPA